MIDLAFAEALVKACMYDLSLGSRSLKGIDDEARLIRVA